MSVSAAALLLSFTAFGDMYDLLMPQYAPPQVCSHGCADWANVSSDPTLQKSVDNLWGAKKPPPNASSHCAIPAAASNAGNCHNVIVCNSTNSSFYGPICVCKQPGPLVFGTCTAQQHIPEQINLQIASPDSVVVSFVTFDASLPATPPVALVNNAVHTGVAHSYTTSHANDSLSCSGSASYLPGGSLGPAHPRCNRRNYTLNFVKLSGLKPRESYSYKVRGGHPNAAWSSTFTFRAQDAKGPTRVAIYGDMGVCLHNNMGNLLVRGFYVQLV
jgi:hypothetical protein